MELAGFLAHGNASRAQCIAGEIIAGKLFDDRATRLPHGRAQIRVESEIEQGCREGIRGPGFERKSVLPQAGTEFQRRSQIGDLPIRGGDPELQQNLQRNRRFR